jgi:hypothetical protein
MLSSPRARLLLLYAETRDIPSEAVTALSRDEGHPERGRYCTKPRRGTLRRARKKRSLAQGEQLAKM